MTLGGTNTYLVGSDPCWVIDPGPAEDSHLEAIRALADERGGIGGVVLTHGHADHSDALGPLGVEAAWGRAGSVDEAAALSAAWTTLATAGERLSLGSLPAGRGATQAADTPERSDRSS